MDILDNCNENPIKRKIHNNLVDPEYAIRLINEISPANTLSEDLVELGSDVEEFFKQNDNESSNINYSTTPMPVSSDRQEPVPHMQPTNTCRIDPPSIPGRKRCRGGIPNELMFVVKESEHLNKECFSNNPTPSIFGGHGSIPKLIPLNNYGRRSSTPEPKSFNSERPNLSISNTEYKPERGRPSSKENRKSPRGPSASPVQNKPSVSRVNRRHTSSPFYRLIKPANSQEELHKEANSDKCSIYQTTQQLPTSLEISRFSNIQINPSQVNRYQINSNQGVSTGQRFPFSQLVPMSPSNVIRLPNSTTHPQNSHIHSVIRVTTLTPTFVLKNQAN